MFTAEDRERIRSELLEAARSDARLTSERLGPPPNTLRGATAC